ncbi:MAG: RNA polymerase sigma factor [Planctomycetota bacterium]
MALSRADFRVLIDEHAPALYRLAYRLVGDGHEAEDIVQETLRSAWTSRARYDRNRLNGGSGPRAWLASILRRRVVDRWRRVGRSPSAVGDPSLEVAVEAADPLAQEYTDEMQFALRQLSPELRESLLLVVVGGLTHQETADELCVPLGTVLSRVSRARGRLRQHFLAFAKR